MLERVLEIRCALSIEKYGISTPKVVMEIFERVID
jgi:hypothetical protein